jgi:hypothetical protein
MLDYREVAMLAALAAVALVVGVVGTTVVVTGPHEVASHEQSAPVVTVHGVQSDEQKGSDHKAQ